MIKNKFLKLVTILIIQGAPPLRLPRSYEIEGVTVLDPHPIY